MAAQKALYNTRKSSNKGKITLKIIHENKIKTMTSEDFWLMVKLFDVKYNLYNNYAGWQTMEILSSQDIEPVILEIISQVQ